MQYLITYTENKEKKAFYTKWFESENNFNSELEMVVYDLINNQFTSDGMLWEEIEIDHL